MKAPTLTTAVRRVSSGWLVALALAPFAASGLSAQQEAAPDDVEIRTVKDEAVPCLNVRDRASYRARILGCVDRGSSVTVTSVSRGWSYIIVDDQLQGWAGSRFLEGGAAAAQPPRQDPEDAEPTAASTAPPVPVGEAEPERRPRRPNPSPPTARNVVEPEPEPTVSLEDHVRVASERDQTREQLAAAVARVEQLEVEMGSLRALATGGADLQTQLEAVIAERDDLARQLAQAEARQLYLRSDLERTRSELMRLKGIPPKLVQIEAPPEPAPLPPLVEPEPEPRVEEVAEEPAIELPDAVSLVGMDEVVATVRAWAKAWSEQRVDNYLSFYSFDFVPPDGASREVWAAQRRARLEAPRSIEVTLDQISPMVVGDRATVSFVQSYDADSFDDVVEKTLVLERTDGLWRIVEERAQ